VQRRPSRQVQPVNQTPVRPPTPARSPASAHVRPFRPSPLKASSSRNTRRPRSCAACRCPRCSTTCRWAGGFASIQDGCTDAMCSWVRPWASCQLPLRLGSCLCPLLRGSLAAAHRGSAPSYWPPSAARNLNPNPPPPPTTPTPTPCSTCAITPSGGSQSNGVRCSRPPAPSAPPAGRAPPTTVHPRPRRRRRRSPAPSGA
jgi:hypothetical protein